MAQTIKTNHPNIHAVRKALNANDRLSKVSFDQASGFITFTFWSNSNAGNEQRALETFEMSATWCDYAAFDEFAYQCIKGFDSESMSDTEIIDHAKKAYRLTSKLYRKQSDFFRFIGLTQKMMSERVTDASRKHALATSLCFI